MTLQLVTLLGSLSVLGGYFLNQLGFVNFTSWRYMVLNLIGSILLGGVSIYLGLIGYILLNAVWGTITCIAMVKKYRSKYGMV